MTLLNVDRATRDVDFQSRVKAALVSSAIPFASPGVDATTARYSQAASILERPAEPSAFYSFLWVVAADSTVNSNVDINGRVNVADVTITNAVAGAWDILFPLPVAPGE